MHGAGHERSAADAATTIQWRRWTAAIIASAIHRGHGSSSEARKDDHGASPDYGRTPANRRTKLQRTPAGPAPQCSRGSVRKACAMCSGSPRCEPAANAYDRRLSDLIGVFDQSGHSFLVSRMTL
jgi:hypothetical protein